MKTTLALVVWLSYAAVNGVSVPMHGVVEAGPSTIPSTISPISRLTNWTAWGAGGLGLSGDPHYGQSVIPNASVDVLDLAAGGFHNAVLKADGTVFCWGRNNQGQCNVPVGLKNVMQIGAGFEYTMALNGDGTITHWGLGIYGMRPIPPVVTNVVSIAAGPSDCIALRADGKVIAWGNNAWGQTNVPAGLTNVLSIAAGDSLSAALKSDGTVVAWGRLESKPPAGLNSVIQIGCGSAHAIALRRDGTVVAWGAAAASAATNVPPGLTNVIQVAAALGFSVALRSDGSVVAWGRGESGAIAYYGQTTISTNLGKVRRIRPGNYHVVVEQIDPQPLLALDSDDDGISDYHEFFTFRTNPSNPDTDGDGYPDGLELALGTNPLAANSLPTAPWFDRSLLKSFPVGFRLNVVTPGAGQRLNIETSTNLMNWEPLVIFPNPSRTVEFIDSSAVGSSRRFYRSVNQ